jgi:hypothetical protein
MQLSVVLCAGCKPETEKGENKTEKQVMPFDNEEDVRHAYTRVIHEAYTIDAWTNASNYPPGFAIDIGVRICCDERWLDKDQPHKMTIHLMANNDGDDVKVVDRCPLFRKVIREPLETVLVYDGTKIKRVSLCSGEGYEANLVDVFGTDRRKPGAIRLEEGKYWLRIEIALNDIHVLTVKSIPITCRAFTGH